MDFENKESVKEEVSMEIKHDKPEEPIHKVGPKPEPKPGPKEPDKFKEPVSKSSESDSLVNWSMAVAVLQIVLLVYIAFQVSGLDGMIQGAAVADVKEAPAAPAAVAPTPAPTPKVDMAQLLDDDAVKGDEDAPVTIVEFSDYECPFCARFYSQTYQQLVEKYIKTGKVKLVFRDFPLSFHQNAQKAAEAAECAGEQGKYYGMHDKLFADGVVGGVATFKQYAKSLGLDAGKFDECLDSSAMGAEVRKDMSDGQRAGVRGTPAFFIGGELISGAQPLPVFEQAIEAALNG